MAGLPPINPKTYASNICGGFFVVKKLFPGKEDKEKKEIPMVAMEGKNSKENTPEQKDGPQKKSVKKDRISGHSLVDEERYGKISEKKWR